MAVTSYTEASLKGYLFDQIPETLRGIIGWTSASDAPFQTMVDDALLVLDTSDIETRATSAAVAQLRAVGRYMLWRNAFQWLVTQYDVSIDGSSFKRSQLLANIQRLLDFAYQDAIAAGVDEGALPPLTSVTMPPASVHAVGHSDPYSAEGSIYGIARSRTGF